MSNYYVWIDHGEELAHLNLNDNCMGRSSSVPDVLEGEDEHFMKMNDIVFDALRQHVSIILFCYLF